MSVRSSFQAEAKNGFVEINADGLTLCLKERDAKHLYQWLKQSIDNSILFLLHLDCPDFTLEGRNYDNYLDFLIYVHEESGISARSFTVGKENVVEIVFNLRKVIDSAFETKSAQITSFPVEN